MGKSERAPESPKIWKVAWFSEAWKGHEDRVLGVGGTGWEVEHLGLKKSSIWCLEPWRAREADLRLQGPRASFWASWKVVLFPSS